MELKNDLYLRAIQGESVERPPVWLMRQAGRILPQYRAVRESLSGFIELVTTPDLVAEVTIQPVDELDVDAAIIFSDILVIPEAMGLPYDMVEKRGPLFPKTIQSLHDIDLLLTGDAAADHLEYVYEGVRRTKKALDGRVPLIGFAGAPFTLLAYMVEGSGSKTFSKAKKMLYAEPAMAHALLQKITDATIAYLHRKVDAGVQAVQLFDSWAGVLDKHTYQKFCIPYITQIAVAIQTRVPFIVFSKGAFFAIEDLAMIDGVALGIDWNMDPKFIRSQVGPKRVLQGNLDPCVLYADRDTIQKETLRMIEDFGGHHIANLGHGVYPDTPLEGVRAFVDCVKQFRYS